MEAWKTWVLLLICHLVVHSQAQSSYCSITPSHTMCSPSGSSSICGNVYYRGLTQAEKQEALEQHNRLRSRVAVGSTNQPSAADMMELQWDEELASVAQRHADHCEFRHDCSDCRRVPRFRVGQNIYRAKDYKFEVPQWRNVIDSWFSEIEMFPGLGSIASYRYTPGTGHYTQMTWASITSVGCGLITHKNSDTNPFIARYYVCNYGPGGNFVGRKMYQPGRACSACPRSTSCSSSYPGLCSSNPFQTRPRIVNNSPITRNTYVAENNIIPVSSNIPRSNPISRPVTNNLSTRREPRLSDSRFSPRQGQVSQRRGSRPRQASPAQNKRNTNRRRPTYSPCRNIWCNLARLFE